MLNTLSPLTIGLPRNQIAGVDAMQSYETVGIVQVTGKFTNQSFSRATKSSKKAEHAAEGKWPPRSLRFEISWVLWVP
jgi:hypothetical protein